MSASTAGNLGIDGTAAAEQLFVINLCSSTSPMALSHPDSPELKRYTFFVSRQREEGRERFRLHMGYFATQAEAEALLPTVRDVYPAAWAGVAPTSGVPRRGKITPVKLAPQVAQATVAAVPAAAAAPAPAPASNKADEEDVAFIETMTSVRSALAQLSEEEPKEPTLTTIEPLSPVEELALLETPAPKPLASVPPPAAPAAPAPSNAATVATPAPAAAPKAAPVAAKPAAAKPAPARPAARGPAPVAARPAVAAKPAPAAKPDPEVRLVTPEDTQTLRDIKLDAQNNAPPCFAIQLIWSVTPIDMTALPHLAIFDAYKLYNVEGNRQGRKWYGLRLGFFSDPNSATTVANYVRSDYASVSVVPVSTKERDRASGNQDSSEAAPRLGASDAPMKPAAEVTVGREKLDGFELLPDDRPPPARRDIESPAEQAAAGRKVPVVNPPVAQPVPGKATGKPTGKRVVVRPRGNAPLNRAAPAKPNSLESTLEILGASTLTLADEGREILNDSAISKPNKKKQASRFSKLLGRLSGN